MIAALVLLAGCSKNPALEYRYNTEKLYYEADRLVDEAQIRPELNDQETNQRIEAAYARVIDYGQTALSEIDPAEYPTEHGELATLVFHSTTRLGQFLFADARYDSSEVLMQSLLDLESLTPYQRMYAQVNLAQVLQAQGNWDSCVALYNRAVESYYPPLNDNGEVVYKLLNVPAHIYRIYARISDTADAQEAFLRAETYYRELTTDFDQHPVADAARSNLAALYDMAGSQRQAVAVLRTITDTTGTVPFIVNLQIADLMSTYDRDSAMTLYSALLTGAAGRDTIYIPQIMFRQSLAQLEAKQYETARQTLVDLADEYPRFFDAMPMAQLTKARTFEMEGNWPRAESEYRFLIENYAGSDESMSTYLYLAQHYADEGRTTEASHWYERAEQYFNSLVSRGGLVKAKALLYRADLFRQQGKWPEAAETLEELYEGYPRTRVGRQALLTAASLHRERLGEPQVADSLIETFKRSLIDLENPPTL
jgi:tetratricopeptide (TPR) repeat protein